MCFLELTEVGFGARREERRLSTPVGAQDPPVTLSETILSDKLLIYYISAKQGATSTTEQATSTREKSVVTIDRCRLT